MEHETTVRDRFYWGQAGGVYYAVDRTEGRIIALLYFSGPEPGEEGGPGGEPVVTESGWFWVAADDPDYHIGIDALNLERDMTDAQLAEANDAALEAARLETLRYLESRGRL